MPSALFEFFELVAGELSPPESKVITPESLKAKDRESSLLNDLKREMEVTNTEDAWGHAVEALRKHFAAKGAKLPFEYFPDTGTFMVKDTAFLVFVKSMIKIRSNPKRSRDFECAVAGRLGNRVTGDIHRVGHPRQRKRTRAGFNSYLRKLGFQRPVLLDKDKDGGFDILWLLPVGSVPHRPIVSVQCKNALFDLGEAGKSVSASSRSFGHHGGLLERVHVPCVLFNDYLYSEALPRKPLDFVPLGLSDLAALEQKISVHIL